MIIQNSCSWCSLWTMTLWSDGRAMSLAQLLTRVEPASKLGMSVNSSPSQCSQHVSTHITASQQIYAHIFAHIWIYSQFYVATEAVCTCIYNISLRVCLWTKGLFWIRADVSTAHLGWRRFSTHGQIIIRRNIFELVSIFGNFCQFSPHRNLDCWCRLNWSSDGGHCAAAMLLFAEYWPSEAAEMGEDFILTFEKRRRSIRCFFKHFLPPLQLFQAATSDLLEAKV